MTRLGYISTQELSDEEIHEALTTYLHTENFEARELLEHGKIDAKVYEFMKNQKGILFSRKNRTLLGGASGFST